MLQASLTSLVLAGLTEGERLHAQVHGWQDVGGLDEVVASLKEAIILPLK